MGGASVYWNEVAFKAAGSVSVADGFSNASEADVKLLDTYAFAPVLDDDGAIIGYTVQLAEFRNGEDGGWGGYHLVDPGEAPALMTSITLVGEAVAMADVPAVLSEYNNGEVDTVGGDVLQVYDLNQASHFFIDVIAPMALPEISREVGVQGNFYDETLIEFDSLLAETANADGSVDTQFIGGTETENGVVRHMGPDHVTLGYSGIVEDLAEVSLADMDGNWVETLTAAWPRRTSVRTSAS